MDPLPEILPIDCIDARNADEGIRVFNYPTGAWVVLHIQATIKLVRDISSSVSSSLSSVNDDKLTRYLHELELYLNNILQLMLNFGERQIEKITSQSSYHLDWMLRVANSIDKVAIVMDDIHYHLLQAQVECDRQLTLLRTGHIYYNMEYIVDSVKKIGDSMNGNKVLRPNAVPDGLLQLDQQLWGRVDYPFPKEALVVGRNVEKEEIIGRILSDKGSNFSVFAIVGQGGLGKTTLAQLIYNDERVFKYFKLRLWIYIGDDFDVERLVTRMIDLISGKSYDRPLSDLWDILMGLLDGKKLLLVLDNVWNEDVSLWESLMLCLQTAESTRVLVTTRNSYVAEIMQATVSYRLEHLPGEKCLEILKQYAFQHQYDPEKLLILLEMGKRAVKNYGGLPLVFDTLAKHIFLENSVESIDSLLTKVLEETILPNLMISYNHLPNYLKCYFASCSMFPQDHDFTRWESARLWIAQGYVGTEDKFKGRMEEVGINYFNQLQKASFFNLSHCTDEGDVVYKMPTLIHKLAKQILQNEHETILAHGSGCYKVRHLYIGSENFRRKLGVSNLNRLRTFVFSAQLNENLDFLLRMTFLRALVLIIHNVHNLPDSIGTTLKYLRYLRIESHFLEKMPESVVYLYNLQILDISNCVNYKELPMDMGKLRSLRTLCLSGCKKLRELPDTLSELHNLQHLYLVNSRMRWMPRVLRSLTNLEILKYRRDKGFMELEDSTRKRGRASQVLT